MLLLVEAIVLSLSVLAAAKLKYSYGVSESVQYMDYAVPASVFAIGMLFSMSALGMYQNHSKEDLQSVLLRLAPACAMGFCLISLIYYFAPSCQMGRGILGPIFGLSGLGLLATRLVFLKSAKSNMFETRLLFLGTGDLARDCSVLAHNRETTGSYSIAGYLHVGSDPITVPPEAVVEKDRTLYETARALRATDIVVAMQNKRGMGFPIQELLECKLKGIRITDSAAFFEREACQIRVHSFQPSWLVFGGGFDQSFTRAFCKRVFDLSTSLALTIVTLPIMIVTAAFVYLEDSGPIFYSQERVGRGGKRYMVHKFRSMSNNAEKGKPQWAVKNDPRVTRVGAVIRKLRIDELPQIFNVVIGDMSFVGPRPERQYFVDELARQIPYYDVRHSIKPGITGMAQVRYPYGASVEDAIQKLQYDLYYVKNNSLFLDMLILIDTIQVVLLGKGAR